jgi:hypothetical protein
MIGIIVGAVAVLALGAPGLAGRVKMRLDVPHATTSLAAWTA